MNDPLVYIVVVIVCGVCGIAIQQILSRIKALENDRAPNSAIKRLDGEIKSVKDSITSLAEDSRKSSEEIRESFVCKELCAAKQEKLELSLANIIKSWELDRLDNKRDHERMTDTMENLVKKISEQSDCLTKIAAGINCD